MGIGPSAPAFEPAEGTTPVDDDDENACWRFPLPLASWSCINSLPSSARASTPIRNDRPKIQKLAPSSSRIRSLPKPKKLLWGCSSTEDHYKFIIDACSRIEHLHGEDGLRELSLEYRMVDLSTRETTASSFSEESEYSQQLNCEYLVPIEMSLKAPKNIITDDDGENNNLKTLPTSPSNVSLFSLATHHTWSSTENRAEMEDPDSGCALRLFRVFLPPYDRPQILIEADNYESFIAPGKMYDEVSRLCMEYAQTIMLQEGRLCWVSICKERQIRALVSQTRLTDQVPDIKGRRNVLLIVTGKGKVRAGIFSRRHIITLGIEASTALPMVREAIQRDMDIVILDPNANGDVNGMDTFETSVRHLFPAATANHDEEIFIVAHSAAGAQTVRYLLGSKQVGASVAAGSTKERQAFGRLIRSIAFTDSNHNINWVKKDELRSMLTGPSCLYIKAHKVHQEPMGLGEPVQDCPFWRHRFGNIRTIWAGTCEHSLTNYIPRYHIWDHFDSFMSRHSDTN